MHLPLRLHLLPHLVPATVLHDATHLQCLLASQVQAVVNQAVPIHLYHHQQQQHLLLLLLLPLPLLLQVLATVVQAHVQLQSKSHAAQLL